MNKDMLDLLSQIAILFPTFLLVFTFRGFFKALIATLMGDNTPRLAGFLTLNPLAHVDIYGILLLLAILFFIGGLLPGMVARGVLLVCLIIMGIRWVHPVPISESSFTWKNLGMVLTILSGVFGGLMLSLIFLYLRHYVPFGILPPNVAIAFFQIISAVIELSLFFCAFDLIPLPPFDGGRLLAFFAPRSLQPFVQMLEEYSLFIFIGLLILPGDVFFMFLSHVAAFFQIVLLKLVI